MTSTRTLLLSAVAVAASFATGLGLAGAASVPGVAMLAPVAAAPATGQAATPPVVSGLPDFTGLVEQTKSSVVSISVEAERPAMSGSFQGEVPELFKRFFGDQFKFEIPPQQRQPQQGLGSGFIISSDGYILSNNHVVANAKKVMVRLSDRRELQAEIVGTDERSDVALLKIDAKDLPVSRIGRSEGLKAGAWVFAIGMPFGFDYSVTAGIVSALSRGLPNQSYVPFIQTDVAINPGNSGGPLFDLGGEVVGINSQIFSGTGGYMGLSFAIPIDYAMNIVEQLKQDGKVTRGWLGVSYQEVDRDLATSFGLPRPEGALVTGVLADGPAEKGGMREGDVVIAVDGRPVRTAADLPQQIGLKKPGSNVSVLVMREGKQKTLKVRIGEMPADQQGVAESPAPGGKPGPAAADRLGLLVEPLPPARANDLGIKGGVIVARIAGEPAAATELRPGDVIVAVNNKEVAGVEAFRQAVSALPAGKWVPLLVNRNGNPRYIPIEVK
ncbi:MAG: DegQ family serine endoprotease [Gammaproteobacteria bacterium]